MLDKIVLFCGRMGSGKTTLANFLFDSLNSMGYNVYKESFARLLKQKLGDLLKSDFITNTDLKNESVIFKNKLIRCRHLLQTLGDIIRSADKDYFVKHLSYSFKNYKGGIVIIDDLRYFNELAHMVSFTKRLYIVCINSDKDNTDNTDEANHSSENYDDLLSCIKPFYLGYKRVYLLELDSYKTRDTMDDKEVLLDFLGVD